MARFIYFLGGTFKPQSGVGSHHLRWLCLVTHRRSAYYNNILRPHVSSMDNNSKNTWKLALQAHC